MSKQCEDEHQQTESDSSPDSTDVSLSTEPTSTELEPSFSIETSLLPDQLICENDLVAEQETEVLPQPLIIDGLIGELNAVEEDLSSPDVDKSLLAEQEVTTQEILDSYGDNQTIALDFEESEGDESFDSTEFPLSGHNQIQQLLLEPVQELEEQELLTDTSDASQVESEVLEQESQPISEDEWIEQERIGLEIRDSQLDLPESSLDQIFEEPYTQEHLEQLVSDYREASELRSVLAQDQEPQQNDLGTPITEAERPIHTEQEDSPPTLESTSTPSSETILSVNAPPSYFTSQESVSSRLFSELFLVEESHESLTPIVFDAQLTQAQLPSTDLEADFLTSNRIQTLEPEISPIEDYLASLDSPRLFEQFHEQMQEEVNQLLLLDEVHSLPNLENSLELVSECPTLPTPPPYDFLQDLEDQEEANQPTSPTRSHLLRSLEQTRLRQEVANYQFALRNLPTLTNPLQPDVRTATLQKSPSSSESQVKANEQAPSSSKTTNQHKEVSLTLDKFLTPQTPTEIQRYELSSERGIWGHLALHLPLLGNAGTDKFLDSFILNRSQEHEIAKALTDKSWSSVKEHMLHYAHQLDTVLDPQIMDIIIDWSKSQLSIKLDHIQEGTKWTITRASTQHEFMETPTTEIIFKPLGWRGERLNEIKTTSMNQLEPQVNFDKWLFRRYDRWIQGIHNTDILEKKYDRLLLQTRLITEYDGVEHPLFKMGNAIFPDRQEPYNRQSVNLKLSNEEIKSTDISYKDFIPYKSVEIRIHLKSHWDSKEITGFLTTHVREDLLDKLRLKPSEKDIEELIAQDKILEGIATLNSDFKEGDSIFTREQVTTDDLTKFPKNLRNQFGKFDHKKFRQPDFVILGYKDRETSKINIVLVEVKISKTEFKTNAKGSGRGQPFRDTRWHLYTLKEGCKKYFPDVKEEDIEVSYYIFTAEVDDDDNIVINGEELIRDVPSPYVYPYTGIIVKNDRDVNRMIEHIRYSYIADSEESKND